MLAFCLPDKYITMNKTNIDLALAALSEALTSNDTPTFDNNPKEFLKKVPFRSFSGDHIYGGKILAFASAGITDGATKQQVYITDDSVHITKLKVDTVRENLLVEGDISAKTVRADVLEVKEIRADIKFEKDQSVTFGGDNVYGKGLLWTGAGYTKQFVYNQNPDRFFSSESIDVNKEKHFSIAGAMVLSSEELGPSITKSNLRELGRLRGLLVDGSISINSYLYYNHTTDRLGLGTDSPKAAFNIVEDDVSVVLGTKESSRGVIGTHTGHVLELVTDNIARVSIGTNGNILLGNRTQAPIQVQIHGTLGVNVNTPDPRVALHVNGSVKFNDKLQMSAPSAPTEGTFAQGDLVWNSNPQPRGYVGWVCTRAGSPGVWSPFGLIA
jgi:hypothetical protein